MGTLIPRWLSFWPSSKLLPVLDMLVVENERIDIWRTSTQAWNITKGI